jgi:hypothetical protein
MKDEDGYAVALAAVRVYMYIVYVFPGYGIRNTYRECCVLSNRSMYVVNSSAIGSPGLSLHHRTVCLGQLCFEQYKYLQILLWKTTGQFTPYMRHVN